MDKRAFEAEGDRVLAAAADDGVVLRLLGALAFAKRCPGHVHLQDRLGREYTDIDYAGYGRQADSIRRVLSREGYAEDTMTFVESEGSRMVWNHPGTRLHIDVFLDKLSFCHTVSWKGRLEIHDQTIPLAEMLMQKMQIVQINEKDLIDTIMLLLEHRITEDDQGVNMDLVADVCSKDWGWWRTLTMNLDKVKQMAATYDELSGEEQRRVAEQVDDAFGRIDRRPKSVGWKMRAKIGDRRKWYQDVGELAMPVQEG